MGMPHCGVQSWGMDTDGVIRGLASRQHGVVARRQLLGTGISASAIGNCVRNRRLEPLHRGVYRFGPLQGRLEKPMAAVLACGVGAVLSHRSAGRLHGLIPRGGPDDPVEVSVQERHPERPGIHVYRVQGLPADEVTVANGIPATSPARTLLDLGAVLAGTDLERAIARGERDGLITIAELNALLDRYAGRHGTVALRAVLGAAGGPALTRSEAEALFLDLVRRARLPPPRTNARLKGFEVDFLWRTQRLVVEVDGYTFHSSARVFEGDRRRDRVLTAAGFNVMRVTLRDLTEDAEAVLVQVAQALVRRPC